MLPNISVISFYFTIEIMVDILQKSAFLGDRLGLRHKKVWTAHVHSCATHGGCVSALNRPPTKHHHVTKKWSQVSFYFFWDFLGFFGSFLSVLVRIWPLNVLSKSTHFLFFFFFFFFFDKHILVV